MTEAELIDSVAKSAGVSMADTERTIGAFFDTRTGRNPQTGDTVKIAASRALRFSPSATLKSELNPNRKK
jgi:nucleoid DNA-binding protein